MTAEGGQVTSYLQEFIHFVSHHPDYAYGVLFLAAFLEAVPVIGSIVPGSTILLGLSALIATGDLSLWAVFAAAIAGALIGDGSAFLAGHRYQARILGNWPLDQHPDLIARSEAFFHRYGTAAIFFARFLPPIRAFVPLIAGILKMPPYRFFLVNVPAILVWAPVNILPGFVAGSAFGRAGAIAEHLMLPLFGSAIAIVFLLWIYRRMAQTP